jgi:hypothetical protein
VALPGKPQPPAVEVVAQQHQDPDRFVRQRVEQPGQDRALAHRCGPHARHHQRPVAFRRLPPGVGPRVLQDRAHMADVGGPLVLACVEDRRAGDQHGLTGVEQIPQPLDRGEAMLGPLPVDASTDAAIPIGFGAPSASRAP